MFEDNFIFYKVISIWLIFSLFIFVNNIQHDSIPKFTNIDYYQSFSKTKECFIIHHYHPTGPNFLLVHIVYRLKYYKLTLIKKIINRRYKLKKINISCENSIIFPNIVSDYVKLEIIIYYKLFHKENSIDSSIYVLNEDFNGMPLMIVTIKNYFGLNVKFSDSINNTLHEYDENFLEVEEYLLSISKNVGSICVFTEYNQRLILNPKKIFLGENDLITGINIEYIHDGELITTEYFPAFECYPDDKSSNETVHLIYEGNKSNVYINLGYWHLGVMTPFFGVSRISFWNLKIVTNYTMRQFPRYSKKLYLEKATTSFSYQHNNITFVEIYSRSNILYYKKFIIFIQISPGVKRKKLFIL